MLFKTFSRNYCENGKARFVKSWNFANKQLYGQVIKEKKPRAAPKIISSPTDNDISSEIHWVLGSSPNKNRIFPNNNIVATNERPIEQKRNFEGILKISLLGSTGIDQPDTIPELIDYNEVPSVGKILQATMSDSARRALQRWKLTKIEELGEEGFAILQKETLNRGLRFHNLLENYFTGEEIRPDQQEDLTWKSVQSILPEIERKATFVEKRITHPTLQYKGVVDCVSNIRNNIVAIEWKNSEKPKPTLASSYDAPLQLSAYVGALNANYNLGITCGMVVIAYTNGKPADYFKLDEILLRKYWSAWLLRVQEYWIRRRDGTLPGPDQMV